METEADKKTDELPLKKASMQCQVCGKTTRILKKKNSMVEKKSLLHDENHSFLAELVFLRKSWELEENILDEWSKTCFTKRTNIAEFVNLPLTPSSIVQACIRDTVDWFQTTAIQQIPQKGRHPPFLFPSAYKRRLYYTVCSLLSAVF